MPKQLFPYQQEALRALTSSHAGVQRTLLSLPTGTGKTFTAAMYLKHACLDLGKTVVWIAHSEELLSQAYEVFTNELGIPHGNVARLFDKHREWDKADDAKVWLMNNLITRRPDQPDFIVIDEAHHAAAETYRDCLSTFCAYRSDGPKVLEHRMA